MPLISSHGPAWTLVNGLAQRTGITTDECGLWALLGAER